MNPNQEKFNRHLKSLNACDESREFANGKTLKQAWRLCHRADWLLWYAAKRNVDHKLLVLAACKCARTVIKYVPKSEKRPLAAIEIAEKWANGDETISLKDIYAAYDAAAAAAYAADIANPAVYIAAYAASAAAYSVNVAANADNVANADSVASAAAYAADAAAYAANDEIKNQKKCATIVRRIIQCPSSDF